MQQAEQQRVCQNNPFGRLNRGRIGGQAGRRGGGGVIPLRGIYGITSEGQHCPHVFHSITSKSSLYKKLKLYGLSSDFQMRR